MESKKKVTLITGLNAEDVIVEDFVNEIRRVGNDTLSQDGRLDVLPIHRFRRIRGIDRFGNEEIETIHIAITKEVEELLQALMNSIGEKKNLEDE